MAGLFAQIFRTGELANTSEYAYERLRARASAREGDGAALIAAGAGIAAAVAWGLGGYVVASIVAAMTHQPVAPAGTLPTNFARVTLVNVVFALVFAIAVLRLTYEWRMARAMQRLLNRAGCPFCEFSLVGLTPKMGAVTCPECGQMVVLADHHIPPDALLALRQVRIPDAGPLGSFKGELPARAARSIRRQYGGVPTRSQPAAPRPDAPGGGEFLSD